MDRKTFDELKNHTNTKFEFNRENILEKSMSLFSSYSYYHDLFIEELKILKTMKHDRDKLYGILYADLRRGPLDMRHKTEIEPHIFSNENYYRMSLKITDQETIVKYLEDVLDFIKKSSFHISNIVSLIKMERGIE